MKAWEGPETEGKEKNKTSLAKRQIRKCSRNGVNMSLSDAFPAHCIGVVTGSAVTLVLRVPFQRSLFALAATSVLIGSSFLLLHKQ